jgi:diguanylate cyclase
VSRINAPDDALEQQIVRLLSLTAENGAGEEDWQPVMRELYERYRTQQRMLERLTRISDHFQRAERDRGKSYAEKLQRKVRQIEKIVRISDRYQAMLHGLNERLMAISTHDQLTGLPNRRFMHERLQQEMALAYRQQKIFSVALADVDHFKRINDTCGHQTGDIILATLGECFRENLRESDTCARWGGEEFLFLFSSCSLNGAIALSERIRMAVARLDVKALLESGSLSVSLGVAEYRMGQSIDELLSLADEALYRAKSQGRNRIEPAVPDNPDFPLFSP